jgi:hypothetical protein
MLQKIWIFRHESLAFAARTGRLNVDATIASKLFPLSTPRRNTMTNGCHPVKKDPDSKKEESSAESPKK